MTEPESSRSRPKGGYDVFLSFRGEDTRKTITDHLYHALIQAGIRTFRDDNENELPPRGGEISPQLLRAIEGSRISVVVFSTNYASSRWCLDELVKIIECTQKTHQVVVPIFYDTDPSDVRKQTGSYAKAFDEHEEHFKEEMEKVNRWREALAQAANLPGWGLNDEANGYQAEFIKRVVNDVACKLGNKTLHVAKHLVGISSRVQGVISLLKGARNNVGIVGIHGIVGIGKTTIAKVVFNNLYFEFEGSSFLSGVKEISDKPNDLVELQERLLHDILKPNVWKINNVYEGMILIKERLHCKKVLVVFDNVENREQLEALMGERCWFGAGSKIIVVTRNKHLLTEVEFDGMYHAMELDRDQSLQLFSLHAFRETGPIKDYEELSEKVVDYCEGLPLALKILGSHLFGKDKNVWEIDIAHWQNIPHDDIQGKLRVSFDALDVEISEIFLDITCFFVGQDKDYVANIVGARYYCHPDVAFRALIGRSLIAIDTENRLWMHGIVRKMGREIIRQRSLNHPGNCSRIVLPKDAHTVLQGNPSETRVAPLLTGSTRQPISNISPNGRFRRVFTYWEKGELLGSGSFGSVYEGISDDGDFFAVKEVSLLDQGTEGKQSIYQLEQEIALLSGFEHENIVQYYGTDKVVNNKNQGYGLSADIWSLGCTVLEMLTRQIPYSELEFMQALFKIGKGVPPLVPDSLSNDARDFILQCLQVNPNDRPTAAVLLDHPFVKKNLSTSLGSASIIEV